MKTNNIRFMSLLVLIFAAGILFGCAAGKVNLVEQGTVVIERVPSRNISVAEVYAYQYEDSMVIQGKVKRQYSSGYIGGHVDIAIISPKGDILEQESTFFLPRGRKQKRKREASFSVRISSPPPRGSTIRAAYHGLSERSLRKCPSRKNRAVPANGKRER